MARLLQLHNAWLRAQFRPLWGRVREETGMVAGLLDIQELARQEKRSINAQILHMLEQSQAHNLKSEPKHRPQN